MKRFLSAAALLPAVMLVSRAAFAETVELVTYYPTSSNQGDLHVRSLTVGTAYQAQAPGDGTALISDKLGIGTANPQMDLDIYRADEAYLRVSGTGINAAPENFSGIELGADLPEGGAIDRIWQIAHKRGGAGAMHDLHVNYFDGASWSTKMAFQPNGNIGIGTATPGATVGMNGGLTVNGAGGTQMTVEQNGVPGFAMNVNNGQWTLFDSVGGTWHASLSSSNGQIGIGTTNPSTTLHVYHPASGSPYGIVAIQAESFQTGVNAQNSYYFLVQDIKSGGPPAFMIRGDGNVFVDGKLVHNSDARLKKDVAPIPGALDRICSLNGITYRWKNPAADSSRQIGLIGQEVEAVFPELVSKWGKEGDLAVDYSRLTAVLVEAVKELRAENKRLAAQVDALNRKVERRAEAK